MQIDALIVLPTGKPHKNIVHENPIWKTYKVKYNHAKLIKTLTFIHENNWR
jgi:hypothetical protein